MKLNLKNLDELLRSRLLKSAHGLSIKEDADGVVVNAEKSDKTVIIPAQNEVTIKYAKTYEFFYALKTFLSDPNKKENTEIECKFDELGIMIDCSRNAVKTVEHVKEIVDNLALMGYNQIQLYTEDTYEVEGEPYWGYMRGRYTSEEIKEIDAYCRGYEIELVPCIQTLAHLNNIMRWERFKRIRDIDDILLASDPETLELFDKVFSTLAKNFTSRKVHIGMDEAHLVGRGKWLDKYGYEKGIKVMMDHLKKILEIADKYGFTCEMWSDMFFRLQFGGRARPGVDEPMLCQEFVDLAPKNVRLVYWDYYQTEQAPYEKMIDRHYQFPNEIVFAGGAWNWRGYAPHNKFSDLATENAFKACVNKGIKNVFLTMWGDDGAECSTFALLSSLCYASDFAYGEDNHEKSFLALAGISKEDFLTLDAVNDIKTQTVHNNCMSKTAFFNDPLCGLYDPLIIEGEGEKFQQIAKRIAKAKTAAGKFAYLFDNMEKFAEVLELKWDLGVKTRRLYKEGNKKGLKNLIKTAYKPLIKRVEKWWDSFKYMWNKENKPFGLEIQTVRFGGVILRLKQCIEIIEEYIKGKTNCIVELEQELLDPARENYNKPHDCDHNSYVNSISANAYTHFVP